MEQGGKMANPTYIDIRQLWSSVNDLDTKTRRLEMALSNNEKQLWDEVQRVHATKVGMCAFKDLMNRVNYLETTNNDLINTVRRLEDELQELHHAAEAERRRSDALQKYVQTMGDVFKLRWTDGDERHTDHVKILSDAQKSLENSWSEGSSEI